MQFVQAENKPCGSVELHIPNSMERVVRRIIQLQNELEAMKEVQKIFEKNPDIQRLLTIMEHIHF